MQKFNLYSLDIEWMNIIKLGGSVITNKNEYKSLNLDTLKRLVDELPKEDFILVHGAGSFGHILAKKYDLTNGVKNNQKGFAEVHRDVMELNSKVIDVLLQRGINAISIPPNAFYTKGENFSCEIFDKYLESGFVPVSFGDVVLDNEKGMSICSGDYIILELARRYSPDKVIFVADVDGVFDKNPKIYEDAKLLDVYEDAEFEEEVDDVTGSLKAKVEVMKEISTMCEKTIVINGKVDGRLRDALAGKDVIGTVIK